MTNLARIRKNNGISQKELAMLCGISIKTVQAYEQRLKDINRAEAKTLFKISQIPISIFLIRLYASFSFFFFFSISL